MSIIGKIRKERCGTTHYEGCACHERGWLQRVQALEAELESARTGSWCKDCEQFVTLCSHGVGIDWKVLCTRAEAKIILLEEELKKARHLIEYLEL